MTPPAAPAPITTKSTSVLGVYVFIVRLPDLRLVLAIVVAEWRTECEGIVVPDQLPAGFLVIAAVRRVGKKSEDGVQGDLRKERRLFDRSENLCLLRRR